MHKLTEIRGDMFDLIKSGDYDALCITTNGMLRTNGNGIMGAGVARAGRNHIPNAEQQLGRVITQNGHITQVFSTFADRPVISFPTKFDWRDKSDIELIKKSCRELMRVIKHHNLKRVLLPRPGCANGGLNWDDVRPEIAQILDERVVIISR